MSSAFITTKFASVTASLSVRNPVQMVYPTQTNADKSEYGYSSLSMGADSEEEELNNLLGE